MISLALAGLACMWMPLSAVWSMWMDDALRSVGIFIPPVSLWLGLRRWRWSDWGDCGSWWGLPLITVSIVAGNLHYAHPFELWIPGFTSGWALFPVGLMLFLYASGLVLLFGGVTTWRKAAFALGLLLLVNPVPGIFPVTMDEHLQALAARVARSFGQLLGVPLGGELLRLMFTPSHGVFIAPGCDGLRGSVTMGLLALVAGHLQALRPAWHVAYVFAAVLLAYAANLVRLCAVVAYTAVTLHWNILDGLGEQADYLVGAALFAAAAFLVVRLGRAIPR